MVSLVNIDAMIPREDMVLATGGNPTEISVKSGACDRVSYKARALQPFMSLLKSDRTDERMRTSFSNEDPPN